MTGILDRRQAEADAWQGWVGSQTPAEFMAESREKLGHVTVEEAVADYVAAIPDMFGPDALPPADLEQLLASYIRRNVRMCAVQDCDRPAAVGRPLCEACMESGQYVVCDHPGCGAWDVFDTLEHDHGDTLGGWAVIAGGPQEFCPQHRPADVSPGYHG